MIYLTCKRIPDGASAVGLYQKVLAALGQHNSEYIGELYARIDKSATQSLYSLLCLAELLKYANADPKVLKLKRSDSGKPCFDGSEWQFNISHSGNCVAVALSNEGAVGIDVETAEMNEEKVQKMAKRFFTESEQAVVFEDPNAFCELWSKKEAIAKYFGMPLGDLVRLERSGGSEPSDICIEKHRIGETTVMLCRSKSTITQTIIV